MKSKHGTREFRVIEASLVLRMERCAVRSNVRASLRRTANQSAKAPISAYTSPFLSRKPFEKHGRDTSHLHFAAATPVNRARRASRLQVHNLGAKERDPQVSKPKRLLRLGGKTDSSNISTDLIEQKTSWNIWDSQAYLEKWEVPWGFPTLAAGMVGWAISFVIVGGALVPAVAAAFGVELSSLSPQELPLYTVAVQVMETAVGIGLINAVCSKWKPLEEDLFKIEV